MIKIGVISDTHGLLRQEVVDYLQTCQVILHAGDINRPEVLERLREIAPLYVVRGNNDKGEWAEGLPLSLECEIEGYRFYMTHQKKDIPKEQPKVDFIIVGHSHKYLEEKKDGMIWLNPGSCGKRRFDLEISMAIIQVDGDTVEIQKVVLSGEKACENR